MQVNYWPSTVEHAGETQQDKFMKTFYSSEPINGQRAKEDLPFVGDDYIQAGERIRSMDEGRSALRIIASSLILIMAQMIRDFLSLESAAAACKGVPRTPFCAVVNSWYKPLHLQAGEHNVVHIMCPVDVSQSAFHWVCDSREHSICCLRSF